MATTKDGLPRRAFAYAPSADPSTWKLPFLNADGSVDTDRLPLAAAALSEGGHRGERADIPNDSLAMVKSKLRQAYRRWKGSDVEYPGSIRESSSFLEDVVDEALAESDAVAFEEHNTPGSPHREHMRGRNRPDPVNPAARMALRRLNGNRPPTQEQLATYLETVGKLGREFNRLTDVMFEDGSFAPRTRESQMREATILIDRAPVEAKVIFTPDGDALVMPCYNGAFDPPVADAAPESKSISASWDVQTATRILGDLYRMKSTETDDAGQAADLDRAIEGVLAFIRSEGQEMSDMAEAGRRHAGKDEALLRKFHELLKELGVECEDPARASVIQTAVAEADAAASPEVITFRESSEELGLVTLREAAPKFDDATQTVWITPIKPGWGNKRDKFFYTEKALREATEGGLFNNIKMFRDHPRKSDEKELPERSVKDWFATTREAQWDSSRGVPRVPIKVHEESDYRRFKDVPEQVAFSVLGGGLARPGKVGGEDGRIVESLKNVRSVDWVTEAGAGGAIDFAESAAQEHEDIKMEVENLSDEQMKAEIARRGWNLREAEGEDKDGDKGANEGAQPSGGTTSNSEDREQEQKEQADSGTTPKPEDTQTPPAEPAAEATDNKESDGGADKPDVQALIRQAVADALAEREKAEQVKESAKRAVAAELSESALPKKAKDIIVDSFREAGFGSGFLYADEPALRGAVKGEIAKAARILGLQEREPKPRGLGDNDDTGAPQTVRESVASRIDNKFGPSGAPKDAAAMQSDGSEAAVSESARGVESRIGAKFGTRA